MMTSLKTKSNKVFSKGFKKLHRRNKMLRTRRTPKDRAAFPTELPSGLRIPAGVSPETYASHRDVLSVLLLRFMTSRLRAMYQAYDGDLTLCLSSVKLLPATQNASTTNAAAISLHRSTARNSTCPATPSRFRTLPAFLVKLSAVNSPSSST